MLAFLAARAIAGVEDVTRDAYRRTLAIAQRGAVHVGWIEVRRAPRKPRSPSALSASLARVTPAVLARVKHAFDLDCDPESSSRRRWASSRRAHPGLRVPGRVRRLRAGRARGRRPADHGARRAHAARPHRRRVRRRVGRCACRRTGAAVSVAVADRRVRCAASSSRLGITGARARTLVVARARGRGRRAARLRPAATSTRRCRALAALPGIGAWTAQYIAMRALGWPDAFLASDLVVLKALGEIAAGARPRPQRGVAPVARLRGRCICGGNAT